MNEGYQALTEKEKETLRLLVSGYDAKSMARQLGLSIHTINERLRDARRKMAVSSSREAARQLRDVEEADPKLLGDKALGDAPADAAAHITRQPAQDRGERRRSGWIVGGLIMTFSLALIALSVLSGPVQAPAQPATVAAMPAATGATEKAVTDAARQFLELLDRDDWAASWNATHQSFKLLNTVAWWSETSHKVREEFGRIESRELVQVDFTPAPPDGFWVVKFKAASTRKGSVTETLSLASENGSWKVVGITME